MTFEAPSKENSALTVPMQTGTECLHSPTQTDLKAVSSHTLINQLTCLSTGLQIFALVVWQFSVVSRHWGTIQDEERDAWLYVDQERLNTREIKKHSFNLLCFGSLRGPDTTYFY